MYTHKLLQSLIHIPSTFMYLNGVSTPSALSCLAQSQRSVLRSSDQFSDDGKCDVRGRVSLKSNLTSSSLDTLPTCTSARGGISSRSRSIGKNDASYGSGVQNLNSASHSKPSFRSSQSSSWKSQMQAVLSPSAFQQVVRSLLFVSSGALALMHFLVHWHGQSQFRPYAPSVR